MHVFSCVNTTSGISPESDPEEYVEITEDMWQFFHDIYGGGPEVRSKLGLLRKLSAQNRAAEEALAADDSTGEIQEDGEIAAPPPEEADVGTIEDVSDCVSDVSMHTDSTDLSVESNYEEEAAAEHKSPARMRTAHGRGRRRFRYKIAQKYKPVKVQNSGDSC